MGARGDRRLTPFARGLDDATRARASRALRDSKPAVYWLDSPLRPDPRPPLTMPTSCDLAVVGGGFTGLWTALLAKALGPSLEVVLVDGGRIAWAASGRNGGFCSASLTHGEANGAERFPNELAKLDALGLANLDAIEQFVTREAIDCGFERTGELDVATEPYQLDCLAGRGGELLDEKAVRAEVDSPTYLGGRYERRGTAILDPARLCWGLAAAAEREGVRIVEETKVLGVTRQRDGVVLRTEHASLRARRVALATNAFRPLPVRLRWHVAPVYDYVLMTEPLSAAQLSSVGWRNRQGVGDSGNQFHYYRLTEDDRILWGGYDAIYHYGRKLKESYDERPESFTMLAAHFQRTFPQLDTVRFTHRWGGAIDTCTRFCAFFGLAYGGLGAYSLGYTGLGVGASRFGAEVMLDLLYGGEGGLSSLDMVRSRPLPFPPEPLCYLGIQATRHSLDRADRREGRRNLWLRLLDGMGVGFDS